MQPCLRRASRRTTLLQASLPLGIHRNLVARPRLKRQIRKVWPGPEIGKQGPADSGGQPRLQLEGEARAANARARSRKRLGPRARQLAKAQGAPPKLPIPPSKGPVMDLSIVGLESLSKQNLRFALGYVQSEPRGPVIDSSICGSRPQVVKGCGAPNPCPWASREGLGGGPQPLSIWRPPPSQRGARNPCPFASREGLGGWGPKPLSICKS